jgi:hypothetical protein
MGTENGLGRRNFFKFGLCTLALALLPKYAFSQDESSLYKLKEEFVDEVRGDERTIDDITKMRYHVERWSVADWKEKAQELKNRRIEYPMNNFIDAKIRKLENGLREEYPGREINSLEFRKAYEMMYLPFLNEKVAAYEIKGLIEDLDDQVYDKLSALYEYVDEEEYDLRYVAQTIVYGFQIKGLLQPSAKKSVEHVFNIPNYSLFIHYSNVELIRPEPKLKIEKGSIKVSVAKSEKVTFSH